MNNYIPVEKKDSAKKFYQFLRFSLTSEIRGLLPKENLQEILKLEGNQIIPIFDLPPEVMGIYNHRGEILWIVNLATLLGLNDSLNMSSKSIYSIIIVAIEHKILGLAVEQIDQFIVCPETEIIKVSQQIQSLLTSCIQGEKRMPNGEKILILEPVKIFNLIKKKTDNGII